MCLAHPYQSTLIPPPSPQLPENNSPKKQRLSSLYDVPLQGVLFLGRLLPAHRMQIVAKHLRLILLPDSDTDYSIHAYATRTVISSEGNPQPDQMKLRDHQWRKSKQ